jgi:hypothetical protein
MIFLEILKFLFLLAGPIAGYHVAVNRLGPWRWAVLLCCCTGGAVAAVLVIGLLLVTDYLSSATVASLPGSAFPVIGQYAAVGLVLGFAALVTPERWRHRLFVGGLVVVGLSIVGGATIHATTAYSPNQGVSGAVIGPGSAPASGASVFLDRGNGFVQRLTTDSAGQFHTGLSWPGSRQQMILICVPGGFPTIARPVANVLNVYWIRPLPKHGRANSHLREQGWSSEISRECNPGPTYLRRP